MTNLFSRFLRNTCLEKSQYKIWSYKSNIQHMKNQKNYNYPKLLTTVWIATYRISKHENFVGDALLVKQIIHFRPLAIKKMNLKILKVISFIPCYIIFGQTTTFELTRADHDWGVRRNPWDAGNRKWFGGQASGDPWLMLRMPCRLFACSVMARWDNVVVLN